MITKIRYADIDFAKYSESLENACQNTDYAVKQFLDIVSDCQWFLLVYGDYEAIMPVSYVRKWGFTLILMPKLCQQLGIFSKEDLPDINKQFYDYLNQNFLVVIYAFNGDNHFDFETQNKTSYLLKKDSYANIKKNYRSHRRRNVRIMGDLIDNIKFKNNYQEDNKNFFLKNTKGTTSKKNSQNYFNIVKKLVENKIGSLIILEFKNKIQSFVYLYRGHRSHYLSLFINEYPLQNPNLPSIMIDHCLKEYIEDKNFDFMGSEVENVAKFNERFGAISYRYAILINSKSTLMKNLMKRYRIITNFAP